MFFSSTDIGHDRKVSDCPFVRPETTGYLGFCFDYSKIPFGVLCSYMNNRPNKLSGIFTVGRKNFVITESDKGAKASAIIYSLAETSKVNNLNTYKYFELLLTEMPKHMDDKNLSFLEDLLPWSEWVQKECPSLYKKSLKFFKKSKYRLYPGTLQKCRAFSIYCTHV